MKVIVDTWHAVATWNWDIAETMCTICQNVFEMPCPKCKFAGEECPPLEGQCGHHFHMHCVYKWLNTNEICPLCRTKWAEKVQQVGEGNVVARGGI